MDQVGEIQLNVPLPLTNSALVSLKKPHYDTVLLPAGLLNQFRLFATPQGQQYQGAFAGRMKTLRETSLKQAARMDEPEWFALFGFHWEILSVAYDMDDFLQVLQYGRIEFKLASPKITVELNLSEIPNRVGVEGVPRASLIPGAAGTGQWHNGVPHQSNFYQFAQSNGDPFPINYNESFDVTLVFSTIAATDVAPAITTPLEFRWVFDGYRNEKR